MFQAIGRHISMNEIITDLEKSNRKFFRDDSLNIEYIINPSEIVQSIAVAGNGYSIGYIENPSECIQIEATSQEGLAIKYIKNPSESVQFNAVAQNGLAIKYIDDASEAVQLRAIETTVRALRYIKHPTLAAVLKSIMIEPSIILDNYYENKITLAMLGNIHSELCSQIDMIKSLSEDYNERVAMLNVIVANLTDHKFNKIEAIELPNSICL
jgi:hypothetical protein